MEDLASIFKAYDVRGLVPEQLDAEIARLIGGSWARLIKKNEPKTTSVLVGRDMRPSGEELVAAFSEGVTAQNLDVIDLGLCSTDMLYFASGHLQIPGSIFTASHNPSGYNGIKFCFSEARPVSSDTGLNEIRDEVLSKTKPGNGTGNISQLNLLEDFATHVRSFVDTSKLRPLRVVADTANGMGGLVVPVVFQSLPFELEIIYQDLDGTFPNHPADPIQSENLVDLQKRVLETNADIGLAFDGDADRVFLVDEKAQLVSGSVTTALVAKKVLQGEPGATIVYNLICSQIVPETITQMGGRPVRTRVGHSYIKKVMAEEQAAFGGEHSGHYYFRDNFRADSGLIAALIVLEELSSTSKPLSLLTEPFNAYITSGEINVEVEESSKVIQEVSKKYCDYEQDNLDGLTVQLEKCWFNLRPSNTEPLLRLNLEAEDTTTYEKTLQEVQELIELNRKSKEIR